MHLSRPTTVPFPFVWSKFEKSRHGINYKFEIREAGADDLEELLDFLETYFIKDETWNAGVEIWKDPLAVEEFRILFRYLVSFNYNLTCYDVTDPFNPKIACTNILLHISNTNDDFEDDMHFSSTPIKKLFKIFDKVKEVINICERYGVKGYLNGAGLSTDPNYRGMGLAQEVLKARDPMCEAFGIKLTAAAFTGIASQMIAKKCGYETAAEFSYQELGEELNVEFDPNTPTCKIMIYSYK